MPQFDNLSAFLDSRSFGTVWYWLLVIATWSLAGRSVIGVPTEIVSRASRALRAGEGDGAGAQPGDAGSAPVMHLLDWLSLVLPGWQLGQTEGAILLGLIGFALSSLGILGLGHGLELALAAFLLLLPLAVLFWMRVALARRLTAILRAADEGSRPIADAAAEAARRMIRHRRLVTLLSMAAVAVTALWGALWSLVHPYGF